MMVNRRFLYVGVFLVAAGAVMLAAQIVAVDGDVVAQALGLWPVVVIALGVGLLLRRTRFATAGGMLAAAMPGLLFGGLVVAAPRVAPECGDLSPVSFATQQGTFGGAASVDLRLACGELSVTTAPGSGWQLQSGNGTGAVATVDVSADRLSVASSKGRRPFGFTRGGDVWRLSLPVASTLDLASEINAGRGRFDLAGARLGNVRLVVNAGDARVDLAQATVAHLSMSVNAASASLRLPAAQDTVADLSVNAGALRICAASDVGLRVHQAGVLSATNYAGLVRAGDTWESPGYSMAIHHADVTITANVGSVDVNPMGGCQ
jgi:hypothetical protein